MTAIDTRTILAGFRLPLLGKMGSFFQHHRYAPMSRVASKIALAHSEACTMCTRTRREPCQNLSYGTNVQWLTKKH